MTNFNKIIATYKKAFALILFCGWLCSSWAQSPTQTIRGQVLDADTGEALVGASVSIPDTAPLIGTTTDAEGKFRLENIAVGHLKLELSFIGYTTVLLPELLLESSREQVLEIALEPQDLSLAPLVVYAPDYSPASAAMLSKQVITVEEARRFPATFNDPARLAMNYAGVVSSNDQANHMIIRGNSPNSMTWHLEGVEIVNPNHTNNAGTANDRPTANGGGVNILSAQLLGTSTFLSGAFPANYGNSLSGVMDMQLRSGNSEQFEFTGQIGLIGIDLAAEGPFSKKSDASFLINYRYSTLGILSALGVDLGDEQIAFQDLAFRVQLPTSKAGKFSLFGMGGNSSNIFEAQRDTALWELEKEGSDIEFASKMGVLGLTHSLPVGAASGVWRTSIAYSALETTRTGVLFDNDFGTRFTERDSLRESKLAIHSSWSGKPANNLRWQVGMRASLLDYGVSSNAIGAAAFSGQGGGWLLQPYTNLRLLLPASNLEILAGLHYAHYTFNATSALEPRASILWKQKQHRFSLAYGLHSKLQQAQLYFLRSRPDQPAANRNLGFTKAHHFVLAHQFFTGKSTRLKTEIYYQQLFEVPIANQSYGVYSSLNLFESFITPNATFSNEGKGRNLGLEISWQHYIDKGFYYLLNATLYDSKYTDGAVQRDTRFNGNYIFNITGGKEFSKEKKGRQRTLGINMRLSYIGGFRETPIDVAASEALGYTVYDEAAAYSLKLPDIFKIDTRFYLRKDRARSSNTLAIDLLNMTNSQNLAYRYYDNFKGEIVDKFQLGLIPNLSWRIGF